MNKLKIKVCCYLNHWDQIHNYVNVHKDWDLTWINVKKYKYK